MLSSLSLSLSRTSGSSSLHNDVARLIRTRSFFTISHFLLFFPSLSLSVFYLLHPLSSSLYIIYLLSLHFLSLLSLLLFLYHSELYMHLLDTA